jgi:hypothetical protein
MAAGRIDELTLQPELRRSIIAGGLETVHLATSTSVVVAPPDSSL